MAKIGLIQVPPPKGLSMAKKHDIMYNLAENCLKDGADIVLFPEAYQYSASEVVNNIPSLVKNSSEWKKRLSTLSKKYKAYLAPWDYHIDENGKIYNSSYILDRSGNEIGRYLKCNLTYNEWIKYGISKGYEYPVFDLDFGKVGIMICFDNYFPESAASLANKGAQLILFPLYGDTLKPQWEMKFVTRAVDHSLYIASCQLTKFYDKAYTGLVDPNGTVLAKLDQPNTWQVIEIDMNKEILTNTLVQPDRCENIKDYLHKCRNYKAFSSLSEQGTILKEWDEIYRNI